MNTAIEKVLELNATAKAGGNVCRALIESGYDAYIQKAYFSDTD